MSAVRYAIFSDIHGNLEALNAVLAEGRELRADKFICLGDLIGYGPDSAACVRLARDWDIVVAGDWERALLDEEDSKNWSPILDKHIRWLREQFESEADGADLIASLEALALQYTHGDIMFTHATPGDWKDFLFPEEVYNPPKLDRVAQAFERICFVGHTHLAGLFRRREAGDWAYVAAEDAQKTADDLEGKTICNVGSVGQPRDGDHRASFAMFDGRAIQFHRTSYDVETTIAKIHEIDAIEDFQGLRLREGR